MKKQIIAVAILIICSITACSNNSTTGDAESDGIIENGGTIVIDDEDKEETEVEAANRTVLAGALGIDENARSIRFILNSLNAIHVGRILKAELTEENTERVLDIVAENDIIYRVYLSRNNSVEAVKDLTTGEWLIQSER